MHFRWLQCSAVLCVIILQCFVIPISSVLKELDVATWQAMMKKEPFPNSLILLYEENTPESKKAEEIIEGMMNRGEITQVIPDIQVMKQKKGDILSVTHRIKLFPVLMLIRDDATAFFMEVMDDPDMVSFWLEKAGQTQLTKVLTDDTFEHLTQAATGSTTGHWVVLFYRTDCSDHFALLESLGVHMKLSTSVAKVNLDENPKLDRRFKITECPEFIYFREGKMYRYEPKQYDLPSLVSFMQSWYRNVKASDVPSQPTAFDDLTENIAKFLKTQLEGENRYFTITVIGGLAVTIVVTIAFLCLTGGSNAKKKKE